MVQVYYEKDANIELLKDKTLAVIGYGSQGHAHSQNLRDSGLNVIIGQRPGSSFDRAKADGFEVVSVAEAAKRADLLTITLPDQYQTDTYNQEIAPEMGKGKTLLFAHGFNIHFGQIEPSKDVDVIMCAPKGPGHLVRRVYTEGGGVPSLIAIHQDASGHAKDTALAYAQGMGGTRAGVIETSFREETETDLFGEQVVLCGGLTALMKAGFDTLVEAGYQPEMAYFECVHELKLIVDLIYENGLAGMRYSISDTAEFGDLTRGPRLIDEKVRQEMKKVLDEIQNGEFAKEWIIENKVNLPTFKALRQKDLDGQLESVGKELRELMPWLKKKK